MRSDHGVMSNLPGAPRFKSTGRAFLRSGKIRTRESGVHNPATCIRPTSIEALSAHRRMHMCGIASQENPALAVSRRLPRHVGEPGNPSWTMDSVICSAYGDECFAEIAQRGLGRGADILFSHHDAYGTFIGKD